MELVLLRLPLDMVCQESLSGVVAWFKEGGELAGPVRVVDTATGASRRERGLLRDQ